MIKTLLSIEDDKVTQMLNKVTLKNARLCDNIIVAFNGAEALSVFEKNDNSVDNIKDMPEVILLDLNMPVMGGWEFYDIFKLKYPQLLNKTKIFILTSSVSPEDKERAACEEYITDFILKPLNASNVSVIQNSIL